MESYPAVSTRRRGVTYEPAPQKTWGLLKSEELIGSTQTVLIGKTLCFVPAASLPGVLVAFP